jgi:hypothetical protein
VHLSVMHFTQITLFAFVSLSQAKSLLDASAALTTHQTPSFKNKNGIVSYPLPLASSTGLHLVPD